MVSSRAATRNETHSPYLPKVCQATSTCHRGRPALPTNSRRNTWRHSHQWLEAPPLQPSKTRGSELPTCGVTSSLHVFADQLTIHELSAVAELQLALWQVVKRVKIPWRLQANTSQVPPLGVKMRDIGIWKMPQPTVERKGLHWVSLYHGLTACPCATFASYKLAQRGCCRRWQCVMCVARANHLNNVGCADMVTTLTTLGAQTW